MRFLCFIGVFAAMIGVTATARSQSAPATQPAAVSREYREILVAKAHARMHQDKAKYSSDQLQDCESLYQIANQNWRSKEAIASLKSMVEKYPDVNRTGCAQLYIAQMSEGKEQTDRLNSAIKNYSDCWYGDGVQVGALARFYLGANCWAAKDYAGAEKLFDEVRHDYPGSITHRGVLLTDAIAQVKAFIPPATLPAATQPKAE